VDPSLSLADMISAGLVVAGAGELVAARYFAFQEEPRSQLIAALLLWEGLAMFVCATVLHWRQDFGMSTVIALIAIWMAGAGMGLLRAGIFDAPHE
jgi:cell division protein FtsW (lipid II flippase)